MTCYPIRLLSDRIATAVQRLTQSNEEGGTDDEEFRVAAVLDRVNTTWQVWQGTTFGCVQCHNHPYDPFTHEDYYRFVAFFNNTADSDLDDDWPLQRVPSNREDYEKASMLETQLNQLRQKIWEAESAIVTDDVAMAASRATNCARAARKWPSSEKLNHAEFLYGGHRSCGSRDQHQIPLMSQSKR